MGCRLNVAGADALRTLWEIGECYSESGNYIAIERKTKCFLRFARIFACLAEMNRFANLGRILAPYFA